jgi:gliding motility-associated-like protein
VIPNDTLCVGESTGLKAMQANTYLWSPATGLNNVNIAEPTATPLQTTTYQVVGYDGYHCFTDTGHVTVTVGPKPSVEIGPDISTQTGTTVTLNPVFQNGPIVTWSWTPATDLSCTDCPTPIASVKSNTEYTVTVTNRYGCRATDRININVFCHTAQVYIPNAFTPDGDGMNDILMIRGNGISVKMFRIFSRWGELVFERTNFSPNDPKYGWDGKIRGVPASPDVFVYTAEVVCDNGYVYVYKGNTTILK